MEKKEFRALLRPLVIELLKMQRWVQSSGQRILSIFEGRDAAGKGGAIKRIGKHLNPRGCRVVALGMRTERERTEWYFQRYVAHLPAGGEIVFFDRSWYNRAGIERVMGFCTPSETEEFLGAAPEFERLLMRSGIRLFKYYFAISREEQARRIEKRRANPLKQWKLSPLDLQAQSKWEEYTRAETEMFRHTSTMEAPWTRVNSDDKRRARVEVVRHFLAALDYPGKDRTLPQPNPGVVSAVEAS